MDKEERYVYASIISAIGCVNRRDTDSHHTENLELYRGHLSNRHRAYWIVLLKKRYGDGHSFLEIDKGDDVVLPSQLREMRKEVDHHDKLQQPAG
jgi:hypothetical protein